MRMRSLMLPLAAIAALGVAACGDDDKSGEKSEKSEKAEKVSTPAPGATVVVVQPKDGSTTTGTVNANVKLDKFKLEPKQVGKAAKEGQGHLHFSLDEGKYDYPKYSGANGDLAKQLGVEGKYSPSVKPTITYKDIPAGKHELEVYLANNDHSDTGVEGKTEFTVK